MRKSTFRQRLLQVVLRHPGITAAEAARRLRFKNHGRVASALKTLCDKGEVQRIDGCGPRGGCGYVRWLRSWEDKC